MAGDMNAAWFEGDVPRAKLEVKDIRHQTFVKALCLHTTDSDKEKHRQYSFCHTIDGGQDSRIDDGLISEYMQ